MALQSAPILIQPAFGIQGEQCFNNPPIVALPWNLDSASAAYNIVGATAFSVTGNGVAAAGNSGSLPYAGILVNPKNYVNYNGNLTPTMAVPNDTLVSLATQGAFTVLLAVTPNIGDQVIFDNTTGALSAVAPGTALPMGKSWANALVYAYDGTGSGLANIILSPKSPVTDAT